MYFCLCHSGPIGIDRIFDEVTKVQESSDQHNNNNDHNGAAGDEYPFFHDYFLVSIWNRLVVHGFFYTTLYRGRLPLVSHCSITAVPLFLS
jgi:hypothetical protein